MDRLWAPWRMPYLEQGKPERGCLFCKVVEDRDDQANNVLYRGPQCLVMLNLFPYGSGHLLVVPYQHIGQLAGLQANMAEGMMTTSQVATRTLDEVMHPDGYNIGINQGKEAGAGVTEHIHLHVVPRWNGDTSFMPVLAGAKVMPELLSATAAKLRPVFERLAPGE
jgi:ATP adenylyltransferase